MYNHKIIATLFIISFLVLPVFGHSWYEEFQVNTTTKRDQEKPVAVMSSDGNFIIVWESDDGIFAQSFDKNTSPIGTEFQVDNNLMGGGSPCISINKNSDFLIAWHKSPQGSSEYDIYARKFSENGNPKELEFLVSSASPNEDQRYPVCGVDGNGNFVIAWQSSSHDDANYKILANKYDSEGNLLKEFQVNTSDGEVLIYPSLAMNNDGDFIIAWMNNGMDGTEWYIYGQRFDKNAEPVGEEFQVNSYETTYGHWFPSVGMADDGNFIIAWQGNNRDGYDLGIFARMFDSSGNPAGEEFRVNSPMDLDQMEPSVAMNSEGMFVIAWVSEGKRKYYSINAQRFNEKGERLWYEFQFKHHLAWSQRNNPYCAIADSGEFVVAWESLGQDRSGTGIYANKFSFQPTPSPEITSTPTPTATPTDTKGPYYITPQFNIFANGETFVPGDTIQITAYANCTRYYAIDLYVCVFISGSYFWYPVWDYTPHPIEVEEGEHWRNVVAEIPISDDQPKGTSSFYAAVTSPGSTLSIVPWVCRATVTIE